MHLIRTTLISAVSGLALAVIPVAALATHADGPGQSWGYYQTLTPSSYYVMPGQQLNVSGVGFMPGEQVSLSGDGMSMQVTADGSGNFSTILPMTIPFSNENGTQAFTATGMNSGVSAMFNESIGQYYPQISPSAYWLPMNSNFAVNGTGFAPNEPVTVLVSGQSMSMMADGSGNVTFNTMAPDSAGSFQVTAMGSWSNQSSSQNLTSY
jgi:hypothetical protein